MDCVAHWERVGLLRQGLLTSSASCARRAESELIAVLAREEESPTPDRAVRLLSRCASFSFFDCSLPLLLTSRIDSAALLRSAATTRADACCASAPISFCTRPTVSFFLLASVSSTASACLCHSVLSFRACRHADASQAAPIIEEREEGGVERPPEGVMSVGSKK